MWIESKVAYFFFCVSVISAGNKEHELKGSEFEDGLIITDIKSSDVSFISNENHKGTEELEVSNRFFLGLDCSSCSSGKAQQCCSKGYRRCCYNNNNRPYYPGSYGRYPLGGFGGLGGIGGIGSRKPGVCPAFIPYSQRYGCRRECRYDRDCYGSRKCCAYECGTVCTDPYIHNIGVGPVTGGSGKPGFCPSVSTNGYPHYGGTAGLYPSLGDSAYLGRSTKLTKRELRTPTFNSGFGGGGGGYYGGGGGGYYGGGGGGYGLGGGGGGYQRRCFTDYECPAGQKCCTVGYRRSCTFTFPNVYGK